MLARLLLWHAVAKDTYAFADCRSGADEVPARTVYYETPGAIVVHALSDNPVFEHHKIIELADALLGFRPQAGNGFLGKVDLNKFRQIAVFGCAEKTRPGVL